MNKITTILVPILFLTLAIGGCGDKRYTLYSTRSADITKENDSLSRQFEKTKTLIRLKRAKFSNEEWRKLINTSSTIDIVIEKYAAIGKLKSSEVNLADVEFLWQLATEGFYQAKDVVIAHYHSTNPSVKVMLGAYEARVKEADWQLANLLSSPSEENINDAMLLISGTLNDSAKMISTLATSL